MNSSNGNIRNWICSRALRTRQTVAVVISTCALALGAFTASAAPDSIPTRTGDNRTVAIGLVLPLGRHPARANRFSTTTAAQAHRPTFLRDKRWCDFAEPA